MQSYHARALEPESRPAFLLEEADMICSKEGCANPHRTGGSCRKHHDMLPHIKARKSLWFRLHKDKAKEYSDKHTHKIENRFKRGMRTASRKGIAWTISFDEFKTIVSNLCHYCNKPIINSSGYNLDRKDNNKSYDIDNVVCCCMRCNRIKNKFLSYEEMVIVGRALQEFWKQNAL